MDANLIKISNMDVNVYPSSHAAYRNPSFLNDYASGASSGYGFGGFETPLHATETRFLMESLNVAGHQSAYPEYDVSPNGPIATGPLPAPSDSGPSSVSGSQRSSDSDVEDAEDGDVDTSKLSKEELRKHKNRQSAARSRKRNRDRMGQLETLVRELSAKNRQLEEQVQALLLERAAVERHAHMAPPPPHTSHHPLHVPQGPVPLHTPYYH